MDIELLCTHCGHYHWMIFNKSLNLHWGGETDGYRYDVIFIMVDISEVLCGACNDKSLKEVA